MTIGDFKKFCIKHSIPDDCDLVAIPSDRVGTASTAPLDERYFEADMFSVDVQFDRVQKNVLVVFKED